ncbi:MAG: hypothetical protein QGG09_06790 [Pirellulaceae bacterium]|jgi:ABC-type transporter Mla subunit MlaD|nr:hypothetical protein [Pirellulaceae bacterium]
MSQDFSPQTVQTLLSFAEAMTALSSLLNKKTSDKIIKDIRNATKAYKVEADRVSKARDLAVVLTQAAKQQKQADDVIADARTRASEVKRSANELFHKREKALAKGEQDLIAAQTKLREDKENLTREAEGIHESISRREAILDQREANLKEGS